MAVCMRDRGNRPHQPPPRQPHPRAFTLIELMIVAAIIGVLASIAIPNFARFSCRSRQTEAKVNLSAARTAIASWTSEHREPFEAEIDCTGVHTAVSGQDGAQFSPQGKTRYAYHYGFDGSLDGWFAEAVGCGIQLGDLFTMSGTTEELVSVSDVCQ